MAEAKATYVLEAEDRTKQALSSVESRLSSVQKRIEGMKPSFQAMAVGGTVAFAGISAAIGTAVESYGEAERSQRQLEHAVISVSKGTREQVAAINDAASALQKKSGIDGDALVMGAAQLSTFGLQSESVVNLTKSLADLTVNQNGVNASSDQYISSANTIAKALKGQFGILEKSGIRFTEAQQNMILYGTEAEKVTALQDGLNQNLRETTDTLGGVDGAFARAQRQMGEVQESIGKALAPVIVELTNKLTPIIEKVAAWIEQNPELAANVAIVAASVALASVVIGNLGLVLTAIIPAVQGLGTALLWLNANPIGAVIVTIGLLVAAGIYLYKNWDTLKENLKLIWDGIKSAVGSAVDWIRAKIQPMIDLVDKVKGAVSKLSGVGSAIQTVSSAVFGPLVPSFAIGGVVPGGIGVPTLAMVHGGERVTPPGREEKSGNQWVFNFYGDVTDRDALIRQVTDAIDRKTAVSSASAAW